jgi:hypothetical protein
MKAARVLQFGPPSAITNVDLPRPEPAAGQLLVRVKAAGVGNWDALVREGRLPNEHLPLIQAYTAGYEHDLDLIPHLATGIGAQFTVYSTPVSLQPGYGSHPVGA